MKSCKDYYNDSAKAWADDWYENETLLPYLTAFIKRINMKSPRVLDLCCGAGYESMRLKNLGAKVTGLDYSEKELEIARQKNPEIEFYERNMLDFYKDLGSFDGIACIAGIVHLEPAELKLAFKNMAEVLKTGGYLLLVSAKAMRLDARQCLIMLSMQEILFIIKESQFWKRWTINMFLWKSFRPMTHGNI